jgi:hypothetical protein
MLTATSLENPKLCECGCGEPTRLARQTSKRDRTKTGQPLRFVHNHHARGSLNGHWRGGRYDSGQYIRILTDVGYVYEHQMLAASALGKPLPEKAVVHHVNGDSRDNRPANLVICEDQAYHGLLHTRTRAYEACGNASWRKCKFCKQYDNPANLSITGGYRKTIYHKACVRARSRR